MTADRFRLAAALVAVLLYAALCGAIWWSRRRQRLASDERARRLRPARDGVAPILVAYASQTGFSEELAWQTATLLHTAGEPARVLPLQALAAADLQQAQRALFLVATYGEGDAPDNAARFVRDLMGAPLALPDLRYGVLALGDAQYARFCGFGRSLDAWLAASGAQPLFERIEMDNASPAALDDWWRHLGGVAAIDLPAARQEQPWEPWTLALRRHLNPGSAGEPIFHLEFAPAAGAATDWQSGDLVQLRPPGDPARPRDYSIASVAQDGRIHLLVRLERRPDGSAGAASGWLCETLPIGGTVTLRIRAHPNFRLQDNAARPLVLVGNGSGLAGLRGHLRARALAGAGPNWLVFGERSRAHDFLHREEIEAWQAGGVLQRVDLAFSRDQARRVYVQDLLAAAGDTLAAWVDDGAAIYVCGSLKGMAQAVDATLADILGRDRVDALQQQGRIRRDVY